MRVVPTVRWEIGDQAEGNDQATERASALITVDEPDLALLPFRFKSAITENRGGAECHTAAADRTSIGNSAERTGTTKGAWVHDDHR